MVAPIDGTHGAEIRKFAMSNYLTAVVLTNCSDAISFNQHFIVNGGRTEENWLNEGMRPFAEDLVGYGHENPSRVVGLP